MESSSHGKDFQQLLIFFIQIYEAAWKLYIGQETDLAKITESVVDMYGDTIFVIPSIVAADLHSGNSHVCNLKVVLFLSL